jgi:uncharacterized protein YqeY
MLLDDIKKRMFAAMKSGQTVEKEILRVAVGEITTQEGRTSAALSDDDVRGILRKLVKSCRESLETAPDAEAKATLQEEISVLESHLPKNLSVEQIVEALAPVADAIRGAAAAGQATGLAMKHLKSTGATVEGKDVGEAVSRMRA